MRRRILAWIDTAFTIIAMALVVGMLVSCGQAEAPAGCDNAAETDACRPSETGAQPQPDAGMGQPDAASGDSAAEPIDVASLPEPVLPPAEVLPPSPVTPATGAPVDAAEPASSETAALVRYPMLDAPDKVAAGDELTVSIALTEEQLTSDVIVKHPARQPPANPDALALDLPADAEEWPIDVDLLAPGFDVVDGGGWSRGIRLYASGDSDFLRFRLKARGVQAVKPRQLIARFYHAGRFLGSASRPIEVFPDMATLEAGDTAMVATAFSGSGPTLSGSIAVAEANAVPDLDVTIHYDDPDRLGRALMVIHSPHISGVVSAEFETPAAMDQWLTSEYGRLMGISARVRGAMPLGEAAGAAPAADAESQKRFATKVAEGFGDDLYRYYVPDVFKRQFWSLEGQGKLKSIQITSNSPLLPWELVRPVSADGGKSAGFLGLNYRLARWAPRDASAQLDQPADRVVFTGIATVAPAYAGERALPFQKVEVDALSKLKGFRLFDGSYKGFEKMIGEVSSGFIHFSGHGALNDMNTGAPVFAIELLDQSLDPSTWRTLLFGPSPKGNPFYFFNACDSGRSKSLGGFVQGWGPAILSTGASGFIGGMWPLTDRTAAAFSTSFYGELSQELPAGPVYVAAVLQDVRRKFYDTGDPIYLAYTFYGNANLRVEAAPN